MSDSLNILLVDDDDDTRANLRDILELDGHRALDAGSIAEATALASCNEIAIVILDRKLPDGTAEAFLPKLNQLLPSADIIVVTGFADMDGTLSALRQGVSDYILKPINPDALRNSLLRILERRRIEHVLRSEQMFAKQILDTAEAVVLVLSLEGKIVRFNPYFTKVTGWKLEDIAGSDWFDQCIPESDHDWLRDVFIQTSLQQKSSGIVNPVLTIDGRVRQIRWSNTTIRDEAGQASSVLAVGVDITDLLEAQESVLRSHRLAAIGQTMAALAHESRNALQRIQAGVEMLGLEIEENPDAQKELGTIQRATHDLNELLEEVRTFAAPIQLRKEQEALADAWRRAWTSLITARKERTARLIESIDDADLLCKFDIVRVERVFRNLFENALAACSDPVEIAISCRCNDSSIEVCVRDNGPGLTSEQAERIFEPFFTTKSAGTGLGMSIVQRIMQAHGGEIMVDNPAENGTNTGASFLLRFPRGTQGTS